MNSTDILRALQAREISLEEAKSRLIELLKIPSQKPETNISGSAEEIVPSLNPSGRFRQHRDNVKSALRKENIVHRQRKYCPETVNIKDRDAIAIIGMSGRYPEADNLEQYWLNLAQGKNSIKEIPASRWDVSQYYDPHPNQPGKLYCKWLGLLDGIEYFDPLFFMISPTEAEGMDPQHRLFLQEGYKAFEDAGYNCQSLSNQKCGVYLGLMSNEYGMLLFQNQGTLTNTTGNSYAIAAARISYFLNLKGPAITLDTACSSSLVATHLACQALLNHEIDMALVGGATLYLTPELYISMCSAGMLSPDGHCKTFDNSADGFVPGEGVGALVLKRLTDAEADGDPIYGVIIGSGINQDGKTNGITAPSVNSQMELEREVYDKFKIDPASISYVEMHGTGTKLGDPIELEALATVFKERTGCRNYCAIGSVKSNIGHTSAAAGTASIQKVLLSMKHQKLVPTLNFKEPNEHFDFGDSPFYVNTQLRSWKTGAGVPRRAGISSFGYSGTNAHLVIEEYLPGAAETKAAESGINQPVLFVLSAKTKEQLKSYAGLFKDFIESQPELNLMDMAYTLQAGREGMEYRLAIAADSRETLLNALAGFCNSQSLPGVFFAQVKKDTQDLLFDTDDDAQSLLQTWIQKRKLPKLAEVWVNGWNFDWNLLYPENKPRRIHLPTYPFAREHYWSSLLGHKPADIKNAAAYLHPLLQQNTSDFSEQRFSSTFTGREFFLADHVITGRRVLPGVVYLEMARAAAEEAAGISAKNRIGVKLQNVVWTRPVTVGEESVQVHIGVYPEDSGDITYEIYSQTITDHHEPLIHSQGSVVLGVDVKAPTLDLQALRAECNQKIYAAAEVYATFQTMGIDYGPGQRGIEMLYLGPERLLAKLSLPTSVTSTGEQFVLHPSLIDSALQAVIGFRMGLPASDISCNPWLPFALQEMEIFDSCTSSMWALLSYHKNSQTEERLQKFDVDICDEQGRVSARMRGFAIRPTEGETDPGRTAGTGTLMFYPIWKEANIAPENPVINYDQHFVILCELSKINPEIIESNITGVRCLNLHSKQMELHQRFQDYSVQSFQVIQGVLKQHSQGKALIQMVIPIQAEQQLQWGLAGLLKTAQLESPELYGQIIGVGPDEDNISLSVKLQENRQYPEIQQIRYHDGKQMVGSWNEAEVSWPEPNIPWKNGGVYLISGGAGGLGLIFAREIAGQVKDAKLILISRSPLNEEKQTQLRKLEMAGARLVYQQVDVTDKQAVISLIQNIREEFGRLDGIIHSAGMIHDNFIIKKTNEEFLEVLAPKVAGLVNLDESSQDLQLDFFICFSSIAGSLGNPGQADYATANAFMDVYARYRNTLVASKQRHGRTLTINWPLWKEGGMGVDQDIKQLMTEQTGLMAMPTSHGIQVFYQSWASGRDQVMVLEGNRSLIKRKLFRANVSNITRIVEASNSLVSHDLLKEKAVDYFKKLLASVIKLSVDRIEVDAHFEKYGIDSIIVMRLTNELEKTFGSLSKTLFFEYKNLREIAAYFVKKFPEQLEKLIGSSTLKILVSATEHNEVESNGWTIQPKTVSRLKRSGFTSNAKENIAIIGISGRYPQAKNIAEFWENLKFGKDCIDLIPGKRWNYESFYDPHKGIQGKSYCKWGGFIDDVEMFDPFFFKISPREAEQLDPAERLFLETVWNALEDAGYTKSSLGTKNIGVFVGVMYGHYILFGMEDLLQGRGVAGTSSFASIANRISYFFDFNGPSMAVDTMCSSSATAIHLACESLYKEESSIAIAGGVNLSLHPVKYLQLSQGLFQSSDGRCRSFGKGGDGYVPGEGVGAVILKRLSRAERDRDHIYAVIKGTAVNHGGKTNNYTVPDPNAQAEVIKKALHHAGVDPATISYIEAHGTGTALGDPIEITGLNKVFETAGIPPQSISIGSIKSNIGHLEAASAIAGLTKVILQMQNRQLVPSLHAYELNPNIDFRSSYFYVQQELSEWQNQAHPLHIPRRAGISSFGAGGANAHIIVEEYLKPNQLEIIEKEPAQLVVLSARSQSALKQYAGNLLQAVIDSYRNVNPKHTANLNGGILENIIGSIAEVLNIGKEDISPEDTLADYGFEPVHYPLLQQRLEAGLGIQLEENALLGCLTIPELAGFLLNTYSPELKELFKDEPGGAHSSKTPAFRLVDLAFTLQTGREAMDERLAVLSDSIMDLTEKLRLYLADGASSEIFTGNANYDKAFFESFFSDKSSPEFINDLIRNRNYSKLAQLWVRGTEIKWQLLYDDLKPFRVSLPTYPFEKQRYWVNQAAGMSEHGLLQSEAAVTGDGLQYPVNNFFDNLFYSPGWELTDLPVADKNTDQPKKGRTVLLINGNSRTAFEEQLLKRHQQDKVIILDDPGKAAAYFQKNPHVSLIYFLAGLKNQPYRLDDLNTMEKIVNNLHLALFRLVKMIGRLEDKSAIQLKVLTNKAFEVIPGEQFNPFTAGLNGLLRCLAREMREVRFSITDIEMDKDPSRAVDLIVAESTSKMGEDIAIRNGKRYRRILIPVNLPGFQESSFREKGVYLIIGGMGNIGFDLCQYLSERKAAKLILTGRSPITVDKEVKLAKIRSLGGEAEYVPADITDETSLRGLVELVKGKYGVINGVVHSAAVFTEKLINEMAEEEYLATLAPKMSGAVQLYHVLKDENIDLLLFFSSGQSFTANPKRAHYAAACNFTDAFVMAIRSKVAFEVRVINWGFWGNMKGVETENLHQALLAEGIIPIDSRNGMEALERFLSSGIIQLATFKVKDYVLKMMGVDLANPYRLEPVKDMLVKAGEEITGQNHLLFPNIIVAENLQWVRLKEEKVARTALVSRRQPEAGEQVKKTSGTTQRTTMIEILKEIFAKELVTTPDRLGDTVPFGDFGVDSVILGKLVNRLEERFNTVIEPSLLLEYPNFQQLTDYVVKNFRINPGELGREAAENRLRNESPSNLKVSDVLSGYLVENGGAVVHHQENEGLKTDKIAVIGVACNFPQASNKDVFWNNLQNGVDSITQVPLSRWDAAEYYSSEYAEGKCISKWGGFIADIELFDPEYFQFDFDTACQLDPLCRQFLEISAQTFQDAGYSRNELSNRKIGVFVGARSGYFASKLQNTLANTILGIAQNFIAAHVSHFYNLKGPSTVMDTACSSSLVSLHLACQSLMLGESEIALAGGVEILLDQAVYLLFSRSRALSPDGRCFTFDEKANGFVPGEGCGAVLLKPLSKALADGDHIYTIIESSAINNDGHTMGITTPNPQAQSEVVQEALRRRNINPTSIGYIEAHGTGTLIGDPIELKALTNVFKEYTTETGFCGVGSVKTNLGHLLSASGIASFIKTVLAVYHGKIPPTLNCYTPNPRFKFNESPFYPNIKLSDFNRREGARRAGISSFGFGGTNAHVIIRDFNPQDFALYRQKRNPLPLIQFNKKRCWVDDLEPDGVPFVFGTTNFPREETSSPVVDFTEQDISV